MIKHIVMWNVRGDTREQRHAAALFLKQCFESLNGQVPGLLALEIGIDISHVDYACNVVLYSEFDSAASLAAYATHPEHLRVKAQLGDSRTARHQVDYAAPEMPA